MRKAVWAGMVAAVTIAAVTIAAAARADVIYDFTPTGGVGMSAELVISDAAVQRGSFSFAGAQTQLTGDAGDFRSLEVLSNSGSLGGHARDGYTAGGGNVNFFSFGNLYDFNLAFTFDAAGDVTSSTFATDGPSENLRLAGSGNTAAGTYRNDFDCSFAVACSVSGVWSDPPNTVPEPPVLGMLGVGLVGAAFARRFRRAG